MPILSVGIRPSSASTADSQADPTRKTSRWSTAYAYWLAAIGITLLTIVLRLWRLDLVQFRDDQGTLLRLAEDMVRLGRVPLAGMTSSIGIPLTPNFEYLLAPIVAVNRDPRLATGAIGLANAAGVVGTLLLGWRWFSPLTGVVAGLVYATNPSAVFFARKIWSNDVLAPTAVVLLLCLDNAVVGEQAAWGVAAFPVFALGVEFHPSFGLLAPILVALAVVMLRRGQLKHVAIGLGLALLTAIPYVIYLVQTHLSDLNSLEPGVGQPPGIDGAGPGDVIGLIGGWRNWNVEGVDTLSLLPARIAALPGAVETLLLAIGVAAALMVVFSARREQRLRVRATGLLAWVAVPMLLTVGHSIPLYVYYFLFVLPAGALLIGLGVHKLAELGLPRRAGQLLVAATLAGVVGVAAIQSVIVLRELRYLSDAYVVYYGPPLAAAEQTAGELIDLANHSGARQLSVEIDDVNDVSIGYLTRPYIPEVQVVRRRRGPWNEDFSLPALSSSPPPYRLASPPQLSAAQSLDASYADGVKILSASTTRTVSPGESVGLALTWTVNHVAPQPLTTRLVWEFSVYDPSGREVRRVAGLPHDWAQISDGEVVVSWLTVAIAPEAAPGTYQVHADRLDPLSRNPVPATNNAKELPSGTVEVR